MAVGAKVAIKPDKEAGGGSVGLLEELMVEEPPLQVPDHSNDLDEWTRPTRDVVVFVDEVAFSKFENMSEVLFCLFRGTGGREANWAAGGAQTRPGPNRRGKERGKGSGSLGVWDS